MPVEVQLTNGLSQESSAVEGYYLERHLGICPKPAALFQKR